MLNDVNDPENDQAFQSLSRLYYLIEFAILSLRFTCGEATVINWTNKQNSEERETKGGGEIRLFSLARNSLSYLL